MKRNWGWKANVPASEDTRYEESSVFEEGCCVRQKPNMKRQRQIERLEREIAREARRPIHSSRDRQREREREREREKEREGQ